MILLVERSCVNITSLNYVYAHMATMEFSKMSQHVTFTKSLYLSIIY